MRILVVGEGGREHALTWALARSSNVSKLYAAPGNPGMARHAECAAIRATDADTLADFAAEHRIDMVVVGPDGALEAGVADAVEARGIKAFGPVRAAARIEWSKAFAKQLMVDEAIPTAAFASFTDVEAARDYIRRHGAPIVVKADGLAAGKGAIVCHSVEEAIKALDDIMVTRIFGASGACVVVEEFLEGEEASVFAVCDGEIALPMISSQDHKQIYDGDKGPNTGGMGAYAPAPVVDRAALDAVSDLVIGPAMRGMKKHGLSYRGALYVGLMMTKNGPKVIEFNSRFGDPETQALLPLLKTDFAELAYAACTGTLAGKTLNWHPGAAVCVVLAAEGYPGVYAKGMPIAGLDRLENRQDVIVFHANTAVRDGRLVTAGGRVLGVTGVAPDLAGAIEKAYEAVECVTFDGKYYRRDIGSKGLGFAARKTSHER
ncbi:MAG: phosphoribosylamine--glycine ligase [candidate division Zixibacteria bacterium]|nr:phosphoribosylamine--glycine ligase [candidate division Zixibacteria bacterium]